MTRLIKEIRSMSPRREQIVNKASTIFWKKGYSGASMRDIAKACKCKPSNIYNFFHSKEELLFEFLYTQNLRLLEQIRCLDENHAAKPSAQLRELIHIHIRHVLNYQKTSRSLFDSGLERLSRSNREKVIRLRDEYDRILAGIIQRGVEAQEFSETNPGMAARHIASMITRTIIWYSPKGQLSMNDVADYIYHFAVGGLQRRK